MLITLEVKYFKDTIKEILLCGLFMGVGTNEKHKVIESKIPLILM